MSSSKKNLDMTQGDPVKLLILFAIPMFIGGIFQLMYNMVDTVVVGRYVSLEALAAIGATGSTVSFIMFVGQGATNSVSVIIAQAMGAKNEGILKKAVAHAIYLTVAFGAVLGVVALFGARPLMKLLGTPDNIIDGSVTYIQITGGLTVINLTYNGLTSILRAIGDSKTPLYFLIFCSLLNVALDLAFVLGLNGGVAGVAWATVLSQCMSVVLCSVYMFRRHPMLRPDKEAWVFDREMIREYLKIGIPMCVQSTVLNVGMFVITAVINSFGSDIVAAYTIGGKVEQLAMMTFSNVAFSFSVYSGQNYGAKLYSRIKDGLKKGLVIIIALALLSTVVMFLFAKPIALIFMDADAANADYVLEAAIAMVRVEAVLYAFLGTIWAVNSTLRGIGAIPVTLVSSVVELVSKIGFSLLLPLFFGYIGIWMAAPIGWVLGLIPSGAYLLWWFKDPENRPKKKNKPAEKSAEQS